MMNGARVASRSRLMMGEDFIAEELVIERKDRRNDENIKKKKKKFQLVPYDALPDYLKDNEFILNYYRADYTIPEIVLSFFLCHNESLNIWTHFVGFLLFLGLTIANCIQIPEMTTILANFSRSSSRVDVTNTSFTPNTTLQSTIRLDDLVGSKSSSANAMHGQTLSLTVTKWPELVFLAGSMFCLLSSSLCHLFGCHSHKLSLFLWRFDYAGIAVMIVSSFFPPIYYIFQCQPHWQIVYLAGITTFGVVTIIILLIPAMSTPKFRPLRAMLFTAMGFSGLIPAIHALIEKWSEPKAFIVLAYELSMAALYTAGTFFYVSRIPEKWMPGKFDFAGHSHQIFHVLVVGGALAHYAATLLIIEWRTNVGCQ